MIRGLEGFSAAPRGPYTGNKFLERLQVPLKIERFSDSPSLLPHKRCQKLFAKQGCFPPGHWPWFGAALCPRLIADNFQGAHTQRQQRLTLQ